MYVEQMYMDNLEKYKINNKKTSLKRPLKEKTVIGFQYQLSLNAGQKYFRMLQGDFP